MLDKHFQQLSIKHNQVFLLAQIQYPFLKPHLQLTAYQLVPFSETSLSLSRIICSNSPDAGSRANWSFLSKQHWNSVCLISTIQAKLVENTSQQFLPSEFASLESFIDPLCFTSSYWNVLLSTIVSLYKVVTTKVPYPHWNAFYFYISYVQPNRLTSRKASVTLASSAWHEGNTALGVVLCGPSDRLLSEQWQLSSNRIPSVWCPHWCSSNPCMRPLSVQPKPKVSPPAQCPSGKLPATAHHEVRQLQSRRAAAEAHAQRGSHETALLRATPSHECGTAPSGCPSRKVSGQNSNTHHCASGLRLFKQTK